MVRSFLLIFHFKPYFLSVVVVVKFPPTCRWNPPWINTPLWSKTKENKWCTTFPLDLFQQLEWEESDRWLTSLHRFSLLLQPLILMSKLLRARKVLKEKNETSFFQTILLNINRSICDELDNNIHAYIEHIGMKRIGQVMY
jgi:hypothetical protein